MHQLTADVRSFINGFWVLGCFPVEVAQYEIILSHRHTVLWLYSEYYSVHVPVPIHHTITARHYSLLLFSCLLLLGVYSLL